MMYHVKQVFKCGLILFTACLLGGGLTQERVGSFDRGVIIDDKGFNVPYIATQSIEGTSQSAVLSWQCKYDSAAQNGSQPESTGINIVVENVDSENNVGLVPVTYSFDEQSPGTVRFFAVDDSLVYLTGTNDALGVAALASSKVRLEFANSENVSLNYLFDLSGLRDAIAQLPCATFALEGGVSPFRYVEGTPGWLTGEIPPDAMLKEENPGDGKAVYLEFSSPDGWSDQAIVVNNTGQPSNEGALILRCKPTGDSDLGNFEVIVTRSQWQSGQGFSEARPITTGREPLEVALNYQSVDPKWFYFSSYDSGDIYFYDADYKERPPHIATILRVISQLTLNFDTDEGERFDYVFNLAGVSDAMLNLPCIAPTLVIGAWKNIAGDSDYGEIELFNLVDREPVDIIFYADNTGVNSEGYQFNWEVDAKGFVRATINESPEVFLLVTPNLLNNGTIFDEQNGLYYGSTPYVRMTEEERAAFRIVTPSPLEVTEEYKSWYEDLPHCPCTISQARSAYPSGQWGEVHSLSEGSKEYFHPGGTYELRWWRYQGGSGQQCVFDSAGQLINQGKAAGTPDKFGFPDGTEKLSRDSFRHALYDIIPFLDKSLGEYQKLWPTDQGVDKLGNTCVSNVGVEIRAEEQMLEEERLKNEQARLAIEIDAVQCVKVMIEAYNSATDTQEGERLARELLLTEPSCEYLRDESP